MAIVLLEHSANAGARRLGATLRDYGHRLRVVRLHDGGQVPADLDDVSGIVALGGRASAHDDHPWMAAERDLLRAAHEEEVPVVGVCLGCQILAAALGGAVGPLPDGIEAGWQDVHLTPAGAEDPLFAGVPWTARQVQWHREQVTEVPPGARVLAKSPRCPVQAWVLGLRTYAFQFHPEADRDTLAVWADDDPGALREAGIGIEQLREETRLYYPAFERLTNRMFESMALFLMPADRLNRGLVKDLHH